MRKGGGMFMLYRMAKMVVVVVVVGDERWKGEQGGGGGGGGTNDRLRQVDKGAYTHSACAHSSLPARVKARPKLSPTATNTTVTSTREPVMSSYMLPRSAGGWACM